MKGNLTLDLRMQIQLEVYRHISKNKWSTEEVARIMQISEEKMRDILDKQPWDLESALRIADKLGLKIKIVTDQV